MEYEVTTQLGSWRISGELYEMFKNKFYSFVHTHEEVLLPSGETLEVKMNLDEYISVFMSKGRNPSRFSALCRLDTTKHYEVNNVIILTINANGLKLHKKLDELDEFDALLCEYQRIMKYNRKVLLRQVEKGNITIDDICTKLFQKGTLTHAQKDYYSRKYQ